MQRARPIARPTHLTHLTDPTYLTYLTYLTYATDLTYPDLSGIGGSPERPR